MRPGEFAALLLLGAIWGASFLFMRIAAAPFGPVPLILLRVGTAAACLLPLVLVTGGWRELRSRPRELLVIGLLNSAVPFCLLAFASLNLTAGFTALLNALTPLTTALVGSVWYGQRFQRAQWCGLAVGISGIALLCWGQLSFKEGGSGWAVGAALLAACSYGLAAHYAKRHLAGAAPLITTAGSTASATLILLPAGIWQWPPASPNAMIWLSVLVLGVVCTAAAYLIYFRLIHLAGPTRASSVTFLVPVFAMIWSSVFLHEPVTMRMVGASVIILAGTALSNGALAWLAPPRP